jgi:hypothetical protein
MFFTSGGGGGPVHHGEHELAIGVLGAQDGQMPIGQAFPAGRTVAGLALWKLVVFDIEVAGRWVIVDRRFIKVR